MAYAKIEVEYRKYDKVTRNNPILVDRYELPVTHPWKPEDLNNAYIALEVETRDHRVCYEWISLSVDYD